MEDIARAIIEKTNNDNERKSLLLSALADRYGTKKDNKYAMNSLGELYNKVKASKPHSKEWYDAMNNYDEASKIYRTVIGDDGIDYYDAEIEKERMKPNTNKDDTYEVVNDFSIDAIKDNFTPPGAKSKKDKDEKVEEVDTSTIDEKDSGKSEEDDLDLYMKDLDDYMSKNKKGRDDIPTVTTRR